MTSQETIKGAVVPFDCLSWIMRHMSVASIGCLFLSDDRTKFKVVSDWYLAIKLNYSSHLKEEKVIETIQ